MCGVGGGGGCPFHLPHSLFIFVLCFLVGASLSVCHVYSEGLAQVGGQKLLSFMCILDDAPINGGVVPLPGTLTTASAP